MNNDVTVRDLALAQLPEKQREQLMGWAAENAIASNDPVWSYFLASGLLQVWQEQQIAATETAIRHIRAQHKTSIEQLQSATAAAAKAAEAELQKAARSLSNALIKSVAIHAQRAIEQVARGESFGDKFFRFAAPVVAAVGVILIVVVVGLKLGFVNPPASDQQISATDWYQALAQHWEEIPLEIRQEIQSTEAAERAARRGGN